MRKIRIFGGEGGYSVTIGAGLLDFAGKYIKEAAGGETAAVVSDDTVYPIYGERLASSLRGAGYNVVSFIIKSGEASKNAENYIALLNFLASSGLTRSDAVAALGGGVVGDLAGFAAATFLRGMPLAQIPTTLLAAVDSSVGGKTGIDLDAGKNLAGAFYRPALVLCDTDTLNTLDAQTFECGCAEIIKYGAIADKDLFYVMTEPLSDRRGGGREGKLESVIARCVEIKRDFVAADERDTGVRQILNFGHTAGHAVELCSGYTIPHGRAVAVGMAVMARACEREGLCGSDFTELLYRALAANNLPAVSPYGADKLFSAAMSDKKRRGSSLTVITPQEIGRCAMKKVTLDYFYKLLKLGTESRTIKNAEEK